MPFDRISIDPKICHGQACVRGMRIPVHQIVRMLANGDTVEELLAEYPPLSREDIMARSGHIFRRSSHRFGRAGHKIKFAQRRESETLNEKCFEPFLSTALWVGSSNALHLTRRIHYAIRSFFAGTKRISTRLSRASAIRFIIVRECPS